MFLCFHKSINPPQQQWRNLTTASGDIGGLTASFLKDNVSNVNITLLTWRALLLVHTITGASCPRTDAWHLHLWMWTLIRIVAGMKDRGWWPSGAKSNESKNVLAWNELQKWGDSFRYQDKTAANALVGLYCFNQRSLYNFKPSTNKFSISSQWFRSSVSLGWHTWGGETGRCAESWTVMNVSDEAFGTEFVCVRERHRVSCTPTYPNSENTWNNPFWHSFFVYTADIVLWGQYLGREGALPWIVLIFAPITEPWLNSGYSWASSRWSSIWLFK